MVLPGETGRLMLESIVSKDAKGFITQVQQFREGMMNTTVGADYVNWITEPVNLTRLQKALAEDLDVPPRAMLIKRRQMSRTQKAVMLLLAMELATKRVHKT